MHKKTLSLVGLLVCLLLVSCSKASGPNMKEGLWQITVTMEIPEMPMQMPPQTFTQCLTKEDYIPYQKEKPEEECKIIKYDVKGDTVTWVIECNDPEGKMVSNGSVTYRGTTLEGVVTIKEQREVITQKMKGKWIGECKK